MTTTKTLIEKDKNIVRSWHLIDLKGQTLGRVATQIAELLMGKAKPVFSFHQDAGDYVIAINSTDIIVTGNKLKEKIYYHHTPFSGHLKELSLKEMLAKDSRQVIKLAVNGMLPKNKLRDVRLARLKVFTNSEHPYHDKIK